MCGTQGILKDRLTYTYDLLKYMIANKITNLIFDEFANHAVPVSIFVFWSVASVGHDGQTRKKKILKYKIDFVSNSCFLTDSHGTILQELSA